MQVIKALENEPPLDKLIDAVIKEKPVVIEKNSQYIFSLPLENMKYLLEPYRFSAAKYEEADGSITLSLHEIDLVVNRPSLEEAVNAMVQELKEYAEEYYENFRLYYSSPNRKNHFPYVLKILITDNTDDIKVIIDA